ncbi:MAG: ATP-binding cassette domain-containing protein, partial [Bdellovibrionota bacterium]
MENIGAQGQVAQTVLHVKNITAHFGDFLAVKNVGLEVKRGDVQALIGPSGCGKSTFIRTLNRLH